MIIECERCRTKFSLDEGALRIIPCKVRCSVCRYIFILGKPTAAAAAGTQKTQAKPAAPQSDQTAAAATAQEPTYPDSSHCKVLVFSNQKGGVAKTTTCLNLGMALAQLKKRVLLIDFDVQANLTLALGYQDTPSFYDVLASGNGTMGRTVIKTRYSGLSLLPANENMVLLDKKYLRTKNFEYILKKQLAPIKHRYDFILIDTPPSIGFFTLNALTAANTTVIPCQCDFFATQGLERLVKLIDLVKTKTNPDIGYAVLATMYDPNSTASKLILTKLKERYGDKTFKAVICADTKVKEAQIMRVPLMSYSRQSDAGEQYMRLAKELI